MVCAANVKRAVCLMYESAVNVTQPLTATDGVPCYQSPRRLFSDADEGAFFLGEAPLSSTLVICGYIKAILAVDGPASATWNTIVRAVLPGVEQEAITIAATADGTGTGSFTVVDTAIEFHYESGVTTAADFEAAIAADEAVSALIEVQTACTTPGYLLLVDDDDFTATALAHTSAVIVGTFTLWGYLEATNCWHAITVNGGSALAENGSDTIGFTQTYTQLGCFDRLALQLASIGGTGSLFTAFLVTARKGGGAAH